MSSADPLQEIHVAVNRVLSERLGRPGKPECENPFLPDQAITLDAAIDAFTSGVAWVNHEEDVAGRLLPGMRADLAVLDQDLFAIPARDIGSTSVVDDGRGRDRGARRPVSSRLRSAVASPARGTRRAGECSGRPCVTSVTGMCCASDVTNEPRSFNALPVDWASDPELLAGLRVDDDDEHDDPVLR